jgi:hypothetical protein
MRNFIVTTVLWCCTTVPAFAQSPPLPFRMFVAFDGSYQATSSEFQDGGTFAANAEQARFDTDYAVSRGPGLDVTAGAFVSSRMAVAVSASRFVQSTPATLSGSVPHPFFFDRGRDVDAELGQLQREELGIHVQARGVLASGRRAEVGVFGGPSIFRVRQDVVTGFGYGEAYPYDDVTFRSADTTEASATRLGFNVGTDVTMFLTRQLGIGATVQFARGSVNLPSASGDEQRVTVGGVRAGGGLRVRF